MGSMRQIKFELVVLLLAILAGIYLWAMGYANAHDIYGGVHGKDGQLCCGAEDCNPTVYRESNGQFEFRLRDNTWQVIPTDRITWLPIPGDTLSDESHLAHICYRPILSTDYNNEYTHNRIVGNIYLYCAFIPPGGT